MTYDITKDEPGCKSCGKALNDGTLTFCSDCRQREKDLYVLRTEMQEAQEGSRYLDGEFWLATNDYVLEDRTGNGKGYYEGDHFVCWENHFPSPEIMKVTISIDAAVAVIPEGWTRSVDATVPEAGIAVGLSNSGEGGVVTGDHLSEPLATCIAIIKAMEKDAKDETN